MKYPFRNLIFEGGGVKGIAYVGAMEVLEQKGILKNIRRVGGTSAGAINALLFGLGYSNTETKKILSELDFNNFLDDSWGYIRDTSRLIEKFGWYKGDFFRNWAADRIRKKTGNTETTFNDLHGQSKQKGFRDIYMIGVNLSTRFAEVFSYEHTPRMPLADAVRISMSIPLFFASIKSPRGDIYVDGGVLNNYPIKLFDRKKYLNKENVSAHSVEPNYYKDHNKRLKQEGKDISQYIYNKETLGFRLDSAKEIAVFRDQAEPQQHKIDDFFDYAWGLVQTILDSQSSQHLHSDDWQRTVYIDTLGVKTTEFDLDDKKKNALLRSGREHTKKYFAWFDNPVEQPANRIT
jgi:NTE family protein